MKRTIAAALIAALLIAVCLPGLAEESVSARTSIAGAAWEKVANLELAAARVNGVTVPSGASFSFNAIVGERTEANGFRDAMNGRGAFVVGGGVAQAATTLYLALNQLGSGIRFDERHTYGASFADSYVSDGDNAILVDAAEGLDFRFTNLGGALRIDMYIADGNLQCVLTVGAAQAADSFLDWTSFGLPPRAPAASACIVLNGTDALKSNVSLAASSINDTVLPSGGLFSFNGTVGPRTEAYGYRDAVNGRGATVVGGGVAQVASAIWLAVKNLDGVAIVEKSTYGGRYNQSYVASSNDAILTDYTGGTDFSFRNTGAEPLTISTYVLSDVLYCEIYRN